MASKHWAQKWFGWALRASSKCDLACVKHASFIPFQTTQKMIESPIRLDPVGRGDLPRGPLGITG